MIVEATRIEIERAGRLLAAGGLVAFPTETVYGLGCDATDERAVAALFAAKGRPALNPLIVHVVDLVGARALADLDARAERLVAAFWPGPLTLVLPMRPASGICALTTAGLATVALRMPSHLVARAIIAAAGRPIAAPSANRSGHVSPTTAAHVAADLGHRVHLIVDGGAAEVGLESTVVSLIAARPTLLRPGAVTTDAIERALGEPVVAHEARESERTPAAPIAPGQLASHYAPRSRVRIGVLAPDAGEALLAFGRDVPTAAGPVLNLSPSGDVAEAAANLFDHLRRLDETGVGTIAVMPIPSVGLGEAINDRLQRAAAPRPGPTGEHPA